MNTLSKVIDTTIDSMKRRVVKILRFGKSDIQTAVQYAPYGTDSHPIKDVIAMYAETQEKGKTAIIGYQNKNQKADIGEHRTFATDKSGVEKFYVWMKNTGEIEIGGDTNFAVKFNELKTEFNKLKTDHNTLVQKWNIFCTSYIPGSPTVTGSPPTLSTSTVVANSSNIDNAKNDKIKTIG